MFVVRRLLAATWRIPPRHFWSTLIDFLAYAVRQAYRASCREGGDGRLPSYVNFKRAHYLEKAMLGEHPRTAELDECFRLLSSYVVSEQGRQDDCHAYLDKLAKEYATYPSGFKCYMLDIPRKPLAPQFAHCLRRVIIQRRSARRFAPGVLSDDLLRKIIEAGQYAPTSCNAQPVHFLSTSDPVLINEIFKRTPGGRQWRDGIPNAILVLSDGRHYKPFDQHVAMFQDIAAATQNCLLMAEALGLSACWVTLVTDTRVEDQAALYRALALPDFMVVGAAVAIGFPSNSVCMVPRRRLANVWSKDRFRRENPESES